VVRADASRLIHARGDSEEHAEDTDEEDGRRPRPEIQRQCEAGQHAVRDGATERVVVAGGDELPHRLLVECDAQRRHDGRGRHREEERLRDVVVGEADDAPREELARRERQEQHRHETAEAVGHLAGERVGGQQCERPEESRREQMHHRDGVVARTSETDHERDRCDDLVEQRAELADGGAGRIAGPRVERHRERPVADRVLDRPVVVPRVVAGEEDAPVRDEVPPPARPDPQRERHRERQQRNVIVVAEQVENRHLVVREPGEPTHCYDGAPKHA